jgi:translocation and assembly module TamB
MHWLRRGLKITALTALALVTVVVLFAAGVQTGPGRKWLVAAVNHTMVGEARVRGLNGSIPWDMAIDDIELQDPAGRWGHIENAVFKVAPADLLRGQLTIVLLGASKIRVDRKPESATSQTSSSGRRRLPIAIELRRLDVPSIELASPVLGTPANLSLEGNAKADRGGDSSANLAIERIDGQPGHLDASFALTGEPARLKVAVDIAEPGGKLLNSLLSRDDHLAFAAGVHGEGPLADWHGRIEAHAGDLGRLATDVALSNNDGYRIAIDGGLSAAQLLPPAVGALIGDDATFHMAGAQGADGSITADKIELHVAAASIVGSGSIGAGPAGSVAANLRIAAEDFGKFSSLLGPSAAGSATLVLTAAGTRAKPSMTATVDGNGLRLADKGADHVTTRIVAGATATLDDPHMRIAFSGDGRAGGIIAADFPTTDQEIGWRFSGSSSANGRALEIKEFVVDGLGVTLTATGMADREKQTASADLHLAASDLSRVDGLTGRTLAGNGAIDTTLSREESGNVRIRISGILHDLLTGVPAADALLGGRLAITAAGGRAANGDVAVEDASIEGANLRLTGKGSMNVDGDRTEGRFAVELPRLDVLSMDGRPVAGRARLDATLSGGAKALRLDAVLKADDARSGEMRVDQLMARLHATRDPAPSAELDADFKSGELVGTFNGHAALSADGKSLDLSQFRFAAGRTTLDAALRTEFETHLTSGTIRARSTDLSQLSRLVGMSLSGKLELDTGLTAQGGQNADFSFSATKLGLASSPEAENTVERVTAKGRLSDLFGDVAGNGELTILGAKFGGASLQELHASVKSHRPGHVALATNMHGEFKAPFELATIADATIGGNDIAARITKFVGKLGDQHLRLDQPLSLAKSGEDVSFSGLRLALGSGQLSGSASLKGDSVLAKLAARDVPLTLAEAFDGKGAVGGAVDADVDVRGTVERPTGRIAMATHGLRLAMPQRQDLPPIDLTVEAQVQPSRLVLSGRVAGPKGEVIDLSGAVPIKLTQHPFSATLPSNGALSLQIKGDGQLENFADLLPIGEDRLSGHYHLDLSATGTIAAPTASGHVTLDHGHYESLSFGTVLDGMTLDLAGDRDRIVVRQFSANDGGKGTLGIGGTILLAATPGPAFDAAASLHSFQLVHRDDAVGHGSGDIHVLGTLAEPRVVARLKIDDAELYLPDRLPPSVRVLDVTEIDSTTGQVLRQPAPRSEKAPVVAALDVKLDVPGQVFVRGRGLDSEWKGHFDVGGTSAALDIQGSLELVHGTMNFLGKTLDLARGTVTLAGGNKVEPLLDFLAQSNSAQIKAQVEVTGPAENPSIKLTSDPPLPQDQILAQLLFGRDVTQLTPLEGLQIAQAAAAMASGGPGVIDRVRMKFGLDRLGIGSSDQTATSRSGSTTPPGSNSGGVGNATVSAGKYLAEGVYVGVDQGVSGESRAKVEVEVTRNVTVDTTASARRGNGAGLNWKLDY